MSGQPMKVPPKANPDFQASTSKSEWVERAAYYAAQAVANAERAHQRGIEKRLDKPSRSWTAGEFVRSYRWNAGGERRYREESDVLTLHGYQGWLELKSPDHQLGERLLLAPHLGRPGGEVRTRSSPNSNVTWTKVLRT